MTVALTADGKVDVQALKDKPGPLGTDVEQKLREDAAKEIAAEEAKARGENPEKNEEPIKPTGDKKEEAPAKPGTPEPAKPAETEAEKKAREEKEASEAAEKQAKADEAILAKDEKDLTEPEKARKAELAKAKDADLDEQAKLYADAEKITIEEARKALEAERNIVDKYQKDPVKMARALRHQARRVSQMEEEAKQTKERLAAGPIDEKVFINDKWISYEEARPAMLAAYREVHPELGDKDDDEVFGIAKKEYQDRVKAVVEKRKTEMAEEAKSKRAKLLLDLPDDAKPFLDEIKPILDQASDAEVVHPEYSIQDIVYWAKGKNFDSALKKARDEAFKAGQENRKILGEKSSEGPENKGNSGAQGGKATTRALTATEKEEALRKFDGTPVSDERKYELYAELLAEEEADEKAKANKK
jgi:hypothetical protein